MRAWIAVVLMLIVFGSHAEGLRRVPWFIDLREVAPSEVLPARIAAQLEDLGCRIPQVHREHYPPSEGIARGEFAAAGQQDIAVVCSKDEEAFIQVFWGGLHECSSRLELSGQVLDDVGEEYILEHYRAYGGPEPPAITHDGINDIIVGTASSVRYCHEGEWMSLRGAD